MPRIASPRFTARRSFLIALALGLGALLASALFAWTVTEWREFRVLYDMGRDEAFFNQGFYQELHRHDGFRQTLEPLPIVGVHYDVPFVRTTIMAGHFSPIYYFILPFYAAWPSLPMLFLIAACAVSAAGIAIMLLARRVFDSTLIAGVWFVLFALHPSVLWSVPANGFREVFLAAAFLGLATLFYVEGRDRLFLAMLILAILCKEDVAALLPVWGIVMGLQRRDWRLARAIIALGVVYLVCVHMVVYPLLRRQPIGHVWFPALLGPFGNTPRGLVHSIVSAPGDVLRLIVSRQNLGYWAAIFGPLLFLPLLGWEYLIIPAYVYVEISLDPYAQVVPLRYVLPAMPFIFMAGMVGLSRLMGFVERMAHRAAVRASVLRSAVFAVLMFGMAVVTAYSTPLPRLLRAGWPGSPGLRENASLLRALERIPAGASVGSTEMLISEIPSRDRLIDLGFPRFSALTLAYVKQLEERGPDYLAVALPDVDAPALFRRVAGLVCEGTYGVVYADGAQDGRLVLARGVGLGQNRDAVETLLPSLRVGECPRRGRSGIKAQVLTTAAHVHAGGQMPSDIEAGEMFPGPVTALGGGRFAQTVYLPDQTFVPGRYRVEVVGAWPWWGAPSGDRMTARVQVGGRMVGEVTAGGREPLRYTTPPFPVDRGGTVPMQVEVTWRRAGSGAQSLWAYRPQRGGCATIADAPGLDPRQVTVEAWIDAEGLEPRPGAESEAPILSKNNALGYYLRLSGDDQGKVWADFNVAGRWALGRAGTVPLHRWVLVTGTYDGQEARIYLNGRAVPQIPSRNPRHAGGIRSQGVRLVIGCRDPGQPEEVVFPGLIASARVWNRVLTPQEIENGMLARPSPTRQKGLVAEFPMTANLRPLTRVALAETPPAFAAWRIREVSLLRRATVRSVTP